MASDTMYVCLHFFIERGDGQIEKIRRSAGPIELEFVQLPCEYVERIMKDINSPDAYHMHRIYPRQLQALSETGIFPETTYDDELGTGYFIYRCIDMDAV